ncbi:hypothetical protein BS50DRAFT_578788 [Corynespora cassiicola Philippines]|uniref:UBC core domain-containing protein n=1 Tax=Corynespora cassiicola Philippines TaxID=1448308 RepID=A0A2T2N6A4_CORCC|nr:hypothetical protein BS50DRAFT_578788 [Corynespora cassiicola Philippines]
MPRRQYIADLQKAEEGVFSIDRVSAVQRGDDDGEFTFKCIVDGAEYRISALIPELSEYPASHTCMIFAPDDAPASVASILNDATDIAGGKTVHQLLELISRKLSSVGLIDQDMVDSQDFDNREDEGHDSDDEEDDEMEEYFPEDDLLPQTYAANSTASGQDYVQPTSLFRERIRFDLLQAKAAGFKVGHLGGLMDGMACYISVSCRISKLGISEEAMQAWQVAPNEYLVALFSYPNGYKSMDSMKTYGVPAARRNLQVRVGICTTYKPTMQEAVQAFTVLNKEQEQRREEASQAESQNPPVQKGFRNSFISRPLNELLEERFAQLLHYRYNGMSWSGAEEFYNDHIGSNFAHADLALQDKYLEADLASAYPSLVTSDHITQCSGTEHSLPLIGTQFILRHFVRCTEFCLICFTKMPDDLQAIKPYVCDKPLCLYQYMSLGFGPSIEHEILSQPKVVDLLVSFCYTSARMGNLKHLPQGLSLMVPSPKAYEQDYKNFQGSMQYPAAGWAGSTISPPDIEPSIEGTGQADLKVRFNAITNEILFEDKNKRCPIRVGDWILMRVLDNPIKSLHCRIIDTSLYPSVRVSKPISPTADDVPLNYYGPAHNPPSNTTTSPTKPEPEKPLVNEFRPSVFVIYNRNFDELSDFEKRQAIIALLCLLPSVAEMKKFLIRKPQFSLSAWVDRLPPAALGLLRWIIASNRACIIQVNEEDGFDGQKGEDRLYGMTGWSQFRFAMGAPDKERRFIKAVRTTTDRLQLQYPTLFAWHGSPLFNWHSIIREGLHFNDTAHGRAYGHGVYHSLDVNTSLGYSAQIGSSWPMSELKVHQAMALNEIVNAPKEFVSSSPHLVVAQLDWIQTRYLFVKTGYASSASQHNAVVPTERKPLEFIEQDPSRTPRGISDNLVIPIHAISGSRRPKSKATARHKRQKATGNSVFDPIDLDADDDAASVATLEEDLKVLAHESDGIACEEHSSSLFTPYSTKGKGKAGTGTGGFWSKLLPKSSSQASLTDYVPGTLDYGTLPMLKEPSYATSGATKRLMQDFKHLVKVQNKEPAHELGWHIDSDRTDNMYQWIVELHSFDSTLPLAKDMKAQGHKSVVLELRFGKDYPMSPPFVRVIRPRFLGFQQGGGGHVTAGGAMCMQLLTNDGWTAVSSIESVLLQVRMAMSSLEPKPARLERGTRSDYGVGEAVEAYIRACNAHGWTVPAGFREMAYGGAAPSSSLSY